MTRFLLLLSLLLAPVLPAVLEAERLAIHPDGNRVRMVIRKMDFRLIEVRRAGDTTKEAEKT